jgi:hypothetical protein
MHKKRNAFLTSSVPLYSENANSNGGTPRGEDTLEETVKKGGRCLQNSRHSKKEVRGAEQYS